FHAVPSEYFGTGGSARGMRQAMAPGAMTQSLGGMTQTLVAPQPAESGGKDVEFDFYHWSAVLRSVSGFEVYRKVYRNVIRPERVAELLILRHDMPRSP